MPKFKKEAKRGSNKASRVVRRKPTNRRSTKSQKVSTKKSSKSSDKSFNVTWRFFKTLINVFMIFSFFSLCSFIFDSTLETKVGLILGSSDTYFNTDNIFGTLGRDVSVFLFKNLGYSSLVLLSLFFGLNFINSENKNEMSVKLTAGVSFFLASLLVLNSILHEVGCGVVGSVIPVFTSHYVSTIGNIFLATILLVFSYKLVFPEFYEDNKKQGFQLILNTFKTTFSFILDSLVKGLVFFFESVKRLAIYSFEHIAGSLTSAFKEEKSEKNILREKNNDNFELGIHDEDDSDTYYYEDDQDEEEEDNAGYEIDDFETVIQRGESLKKNTKKLKIANRFLGRKNKKTESKEYKLPDSSFFIPGNDDNFIGPSDSFLLENSKKLEQTLSDFKVMGKVVEVQPGPVVTLYQFKPAPGVKVNKVINLSDDLALALKVAGIRIYAPVPGQGTVGIEVPNKDRAIVRFRDIIETSEFEDSSSQLLLALGKDTYGNPFAADLSKMPHLLIAGATGTGKSVSINTILSSLLIRNSPKDLRLILIDPKMLELSVYEDIPHLKAPVVTQAKKARGVLYWAVEEMERRYELMKKFGVRSLESYNSIALGQTNNDSSDIIELTEDTIIATDVDSHDLLESVDTNTSEITEIDEIGYVSQIEYLPKIVIVVDELADLMLSVGKEIEELLTRLAQKARASGIHLILATQRPSVNVITGLIKANFPARLSFKVASRVDARTVMDTSGAEKLLGMGDCLFSSPATGRVIRLHGALVTDSEVNSFVSYIKSQGRPDYDPAIEEAVEKFTESESSSSVSGMDFEEQYDPLFDEAVSFVAQKGQASTSMIQRVFRIGYNRAARILEAMERDGIVGQADGSKPRKVLISGLDNEI